jgi:chorismate synthase
LSGNTFGVAFRVTTWGESHGRAVGCVVDSPPAGLELKEKDIQKELDRRKPGGRLSTKRRESDAVEILSGVFEGFTTGTPVSMLVWNKDARPEAYEPIKDLLRPGHADYTYLAKFGFRDWRGGGRSSARETVARVAAGAIAKKLLSLFGVEIVGFTREIAGVKCSIDVRELELSEVYKLAESNAVRCPDAEVAKVMEEKIVEAMGVGDSVGGIVEVIVRNAPAGIGEPVFDKLDARLAYAVMGVPAVKGVEIGSGFSAARKRGSENNDPIVLKEGKIGFEKNDAGGILGGISNGDDIVVRACVKPTPSVSIPQKTVNVREMRETEIVVKGRHDPCIVPRAVPVIEAMVALTVVDFMVLQGLIPRSLLQKRF